MAAGGSSAAAPSPPGDSGATGHPAARPPRLCCSQPQQVRAASGRGSQEQEADQTSLRCFSSFCSFSVSFLKDGRLPGSSSQQLFIRV